jgi:O-antigen/teichoic acid export membrane protein
MIAPREVHLKRLSHTVLKNAAMNTARLGAGAAVALILPPTLTRMLDRDQFAAWVLLLQIAAYVNFLDFGIQTAVARFVAQAVERGDEKERDAYISTALFLLSCAAALAFVLVCAMAGLAPIMFKQAPARLISELRGGLILLGAFSALSLPASAFAGVFVGLHKNEFPAIAGAGSRLLGAALVILAVHRTHSLVVMAGLVGGSNLLGGLFLYAHARTSLPTMLLSLHSITRAYLGTFLKFCAGMSVMSFAMFLVAGLDLTIVGYFQFSGVAYYSVASNLVVMVSGLAGAATSALIAPTAAIHARGEYQRLGGVVLRTTRHITELVTVIAFLFFLFGTRILTLWVGAVYAQYSHNILYVLTLASAIRMLGGPYTAALIGAGEQVRVMISGLCEGVTNLIVSLIAGYYLGPIGVAIGTLVGALAGMGLHILYNMPRISTVRITSVEFMLRAVIQPTLVLLPALAGIFFGVSGLLHGVLLPSLSVLGGLTLSILLLKPSLQVRHAGA